MTTRRELFGLVAGTSALAALPALRRARAASAASCTAKKFWTMIGDYPHTHAVHEGQLKSPCVTLDIAPVPVVFAAFARTVAMEFDVSELSLVTFLQARAAGRKLSLLPAVNLSRFQHPFLVYNGAKGTMTPKDLEGARIGVRLFTATTPSWIRGILADDYGVDVSKIKWSAYQKPNVPEWTDPPNVTMGPMKDLAEMLFSGEVDAIISDPVPSAKSPSFWTRRVEIVRWFQRIAGVRMPVALESVANLRIAGESTFRMRYEYESVNGQRVGAPETRASSGRR